MNFKNDFEINIKFDNKLIGYLIKLDRRYCKGAVGEKNRKKNCIINSISNLIEEEEEEIIRTILNENSIIISWKTRIEIKI